MKKYLKCLFFITAFVSINLFAYQATTEESKKIKKFAENLKIFSMDYKPYQIVKYAQDLRPYLKSKYSNVVDPSRAWGIDGKGAYSAKGGEKYTRSDHLTTRNRIGITASIIGEPLYGHRLAELYEIATLLDDFKTNNSSTVAQIFSENITDSKVAKFKKYIVDMKYILVRYPGDQGLVSILNNIEPLGKDLVELNKNYSEAATTRDQVIAINNLNALLNNFQLMFETADEINAFFNYVAAFIDNGGSYNSGAFLDNSADIDLPEYQKYIDYASNEEAQSSVLAGIPIELIKITTYADLQRILGRTHNKFHKKYQSNVLIYQAVTNAGKNIEEYANKLQHLLSDSYYNTSYKEVKQARNNHKFYIGVGRGAYVIADKILPGATGNGRYSAAGGEKFKIKYTAIRSAYDQVPDYKIYNATTYGVTGTPLYGDKLYEIFEIATSLKEFSSNLSQVFSNNIDKSDHQVNNLKDALIDFKFKGNLLIDILNTIESNGINGVELNKNYSADAITKEQVLAINNLNGALEFLYKTLPPIEKYTLFFQYAAAFVDNGGTKNANAIITEPQNLNIPKFQKYAPLPTYEELIESLMLGNNVVKPIELTRISNNEDLRRIFNEPYKDLNPRTDKFNELYQQAKINRHKKQLDKYNLEI